MWIRSRIPSAIRTPRTQLSQSAGGAPKRNPMPGKPQFLYRAIALRREANSPIRDPRNSPKMDQTAPPPKTNPKNPKTPRRTGRSLTILGCASAGGRRRRRRGIGGPRGVRHWIGRIGGAIAERIEGEALGFCFSLIFSPFPPRPLSLSARALPLFLSRGSRTRLAQGRKRTGFSEVLKQSQLVL